jgi:branched-chain amino acid transport system substrate-binding protein
MHTSEEISMIRHVFFSIASALFAAQAFAQSYSVTADKIVIHHIGPLTGVLASANAEALAGAELYFNSVNAKGGVKGRKIELRRIDDKQQAPEAKKLFQELADKGEVLTLFMPRTTPSINAMMEISQQAKIPMFAPQTGGIAITSPAKREVFAIRASYQDEVKHGIEILARTGIKSFGMLRATDAFGKDVFAGAESALKERGLQFTVIGEVDQLKPDVTAAVEQVFAKKPQAIILAASTKGAADFIKAYRAKGGVAQFVTLSNNSSDAFIKQLENFSRGVIITQVVPDPDTTDSKAATDFSKLADEKINTTHAAFQGYISARMLVDGLNRAKSLTPDGLIAGFEAIGEHDLGGYKITFGKDRRAGSAFVTATIIGRNGRFAR